MTEHPENVNYPTDYLRLTWSAFSKWKLVCMPSLLDFDLTSHHHLLVYWTQLTLVYGVKSNDEVTTFSTHIIRYRSNDIFVIKPCCDALLLKKILDEESIADARLTSPSIPNNTRLIQPNTDLDIGAIAYACQGKFVQQHTRLKSWDISTSSGDQVTEICRIQSGVFFFLKRKSEPGSLTPKSNLNYQYTYIPEHQEPPVTNISRHLRVWNYNHRKGYQFVPAGFQFIRAAWFYYKP